MDKTLSYSIERDDKKVSASALAVLAQKTFIDKFGHIYAEEDLAVFLENSVSPAVFQRYQDDPNCTIWTCQTGNGTLIGYAIAGPCDLPIDNREANAGELKRIYIDQSAQGVGIGAEMITHILEWLGEHYHPLYLGVFSENLGAQELYKRFGFEIVGEYFFVVGKHRDHEFIMRRS